MGVVPALLAFADQFMSEDDLDASRTQLPVAKLVRKHWGAERWLVPEGSAFGFKLITILAGKRTSLHYHRQKEEAGLILRGEGQLYVADEISAPVVEYKIVPGQVVHIQPRTVHRVAAMTDLILIEVSTPELDDVVRIEDDRGRGDGRIDTEHHSR